MERRTRPGQVQCERYDDGFGIETQSERQPPKYKYQHGPRSIQLLQPIHLVIHHIHIRTFPIRHKTHDPTETFYKLPQKVEPTNSIPDSLPNTLFSQRTTS